MLRTLGKNFSRQHFEMFFLFLFLKNGLSYFIGDNLHEMSSCFLGKIRKMSSVVC